MKTKILLISSLMGLSFSTSALAAPVAASGGGGVRAATPVVPAQGTASVQGRTTAPRTVPINPMQTQIPNQTASGTITSNPSTPLATNQLATTNGLNGNTNLTANDTSNQLNSNFVFGNQAVTTSDRMLLTTLQQQLAAQLGVSSVAALPVHFFINNGAVTLTGIVPTTDESQRVLARVQQTPGVISVFNDLHVGNTPVAVQPRDNLEGGAGITDHAFSAADRTLLSVVEQNAGAQLGITGASSAQMPVHFSVQNGIVGVTGQLSSPQEKAAILAAVKQTPGVVRVVDNVALVNVPQNGSGIVPNAVGQNTPVSNQTLTPTSRAMGLTNSLFLNSSNTGTVNPTMNPNPGTVNPVVNPGTGF